MPKTFLQSFPSVEIKWYIVEIPKKYQKRRKGERRKGAREGGREGEREKEEKEGREAGRNRVGQSEKGGKRREGEREGRRKEGGKTGSSWQISLAGPCAHITWRCSVEISGEGLCNLSIPSSSKGRQTRDVGLRPPGWWEPASPTLKGKAAQNLLHD